MVTVKGNYRVFIAVVILILVTVVWYLAPPTDTSDPSKEHLYEGEITKNEALEIGKKQVPRTKIYRVQANQQFVNKTIGEYYVEGYVWSIRLYTTPDWLNTVRYYAITIDVDTGTVYRVDEVEDSHFS